ncbi:hypothetical protein LOZ53_001648 [Ophidiomyces ophidiicola]|uniref:Uncharacterized protein n=1 Tax=Ophidiomyces ophidiicola TaxID=1387563 RepID=A0ACB8UYZ9_9EURO|nr:hypothetical protein LOZ64_002099 [Ophidiomyces ophidiicola]KAI1950097.1 hypothetical protein LOZ62_002080 [Ophidiomyces ophidiicola]KAI1959494.1 hypothetical protein LOZ59_003097 [Ophidiomyces ophidiicola]KAI1981094.1 hypothetical protein LOZ55_000980 [Ophidiomyces ophidiicola]KAI1990440.1 hypothetical protein LOZ51_004791 [Ophidiomyces ophidiicola]
MPLTHLYLRRIPRLTRPLRPPGNHAVLTKPRYFTKNTQLLLLSPSANRPQLPFLHSPTVRPSPAYAGRTQNPRLLSTERRKTITDGLKIAVTAYVVMVLLYVMKLGLQQETIEREFPTPPDFTIYSRWLLRSAWALQKPEHIGMSLTPWRRVCEFYVELLQRMEDPALDGKGLKELADEGLLIDGVGKTGYNIEGMSEPWKMAYFQALMGAAEAAEKLDGWMYDENLDIAAPAEYVVGPSNPNPRPQPMKQKQVLKEENCRPASESPEVYYMKILTTEGFQTNQRLDAALAYADWLDFKDLKDTANDMYQWAMDIATSGLAVNPEKVVDVKTGVLVDDGNKFVTDNVLRVTTALGIHKVRQGDLAPALSIFLSVLRARRNLPAQPGSETKFDTKKPKKSNSAIDEWLQTIASLLSPPPYPLPVLTGNETALRSASSSCDEAGLMLYIGEIIFASSSLETGLAWTRDAVDLAEMSLLQMDEVSTKATSHAMQYHSDEERCHNCLRSGLENWKTMVKQLVTKAEQEELDLMSNTKTSWFSNSTKKLKEKEMQRRRWEAEELILQDRSRRVQRFIGDPLLAGLAPNTTMMLFG